jgi:hypothetical protein
VSERLGCQVWSMALPVCGLWLRQHVLNGMLCPRPLTWKSLTQRKVSDDRMAQLAGGTAPIAGWWDCCYVLQQRYRVGLDGREVLVLVGRSWQEDWSMAVYVGGTPSNELVALGPQAHDSRFVTVHSQHVHDGRCAGDVPWVAVHAGGQER